MLRCLAQGSIGSICNVPSANARLGTAGVSLRSLGIDRLGLEERIALVEEIWDSIAADSAAVPLTTPQRDELDRRLADHAAHPNDVLSWDEVKVSLDERLKK